MEEKSELRRQRNRNTRANILGVNSKRECKPNDPPHVDMTMT